MKSALLGQPNFSVKPFRFYERVFRIHFPESIFDFNFSVFDGFFQKIFIPEAMDDDMNPIFLVFIMCTA